jgi:hypothetical protein
MGPRGLEKKEREKESGVRVKEMRERMHEGGTSTASSPAQACRRAFPQARMKRKRSMARHFGRNFHRHSSCPSALPLLSSSFSISVCPLRSRFQPTGLFHPFCPLRSRFQPTGLFRPFCPLHSRFHPPGSTRAIHLSLSPGPGFLLLPIDYSYGTTHSLSSHLRVFASSFLRYVASSVATSPLLSLLPPRQLLQHSFVCTTRSPT